MHAAKPILSIVANRKTPPNNPNPVRPARNAFSIHPLTSLVPADSTGGPLPSDVAQRKGEGSVRFTLQPAPGRVDGTAAISGFYSGVRGPACGQCSVAQNAMGLVEDAPATPDAVPSTISSTLNFLRAPAISARRLLVDMQARAKARALFECTVVSHENLRQIFPHLRRRIPKE